MIREFYSYTAGGRLKKKRMETPGGWKLDISFEYDTEGKLQYMVYPSGRRVKYVYDAADRQQTLRGVVSDPMSEYDLGSLTFGQLGELAGMSWRDNSVAAFASQNWAYNNRMQMTSYTYNGVSTVSHSYLYSATQNDGKLWRRVDTNGQTVEYQYDALHRLSTAAVVAGTGPAGQEWGQTYTYDGFGNVAGKQGAGTAATTGFGVNMNSATNGGGGVEPGDMDNRILSYAGEEYGYAADNKRILKEVVDAGSPTGRKRYVYFWVGGMRVGTYTADLATAGVFSIVKEDLYLSGRRLAPSDRLGSDLSGGVKLLPYGEDIASPPVGNDRTKFATYMRDASGLDYADQRYYSQGSGRFMTSDPYVASGGPASPNSWNRFAYVEGDPVNFSDSQGLSRAKVEGTFTFSTTAVAVGQSAESDFFVMQLLGPPRQIIGSTPSFRNRWEEDEFFGRPCQEKVPEAPEGADVDANIAEAQAKLREYVALATQAAKAGATIDVNVLIGAWFAEKVKPGGEWDYKRRGSAYEAFGNYNYGAVGAAIGYTTPILLRAAGCGSKYD
jgi:RHS repeat-associated protein